MKLLGAALTLALALLSACASGAGGARAVETADLDRLVNMLTGSFSSARQSTEDPENFRDIRLKTVRIWAGRGDGKWLYVEQAAADARDRPYRQRVYRVTADPLAGVLRSEVYEFEGDPMRFAGAWRNPSLFDQITPANLSRREGCAVILMPASDFFVGGTSGKECVSTLRGAAYATSEVTISRNGLETWDRGWDTNGAQVWGATAGPYVFDRVSD